mgnify:CR=1 FL=1|jgi:hypothetical protein
MNTGKFYKHKNCIDTVIMPLIIESDKDKHFRNENNTRILVDWYRIARPDGNPIKLNFREQIEIKDKDILNWEEYPKMSYGYTEKYICSED